VGRDTPSFLPLQPLQIPLLPLDVSAITQAAGDVTAVARPHPRRKVVAQEALKRLDGHVTAAEQEGGSRRFGDADAEVGQGVLDGAGQGGR